MRCDNHHTPAACGVGQPISQEFSNALKSGVIRAFVRKICSFGDDKGVWWMTGIYNCNQEYSHLRKQQDKLLEQIPVEVADHLVPHDPEGFEGGKLLFVRAR